MNTEPKYQDIPFGQFQGAINTIENMEKALTKTVLDICEVATVYIDDELEYVECYYRFTNEPSGIEPLTGYPTNERLLKIEHVTKDGEEIKLCETDYINACEAILHQKGESNEWEFKRA